MHWSAYLVAFLGPCEPGAFAKISPGPAVVTAAVLLLIVYVAVAGFIAKHRLRAYLGYVRRGKLELIGSINAVLAIVVFSFGYLVDCALSTSAFCIPF